MIIACDPGADGAFVGLYWDGTKKEVEIYRTADGYSGIRKWLQYHPDFRLVEPEACVIERIGLHIGDQKKFKSLRILLQHVGRAMLCFEIAGYEYTELDPKTWQYRYGLVGLDRKEAKKKAREIAQQLYPEVVVTLADADALLIADYLWHVTYKIPFRVRNPKVKTELTVTREVTRGNK